MAIPRKKNNIVFECIEESLTKGDKVQEPNLSSQTKTSKGSLSPKVLNLPSTSSITISTHEGVKKSFEGKLGSMHKHGNNEDDKDAQKLSLSPKTLNS